MYCRSEEPRKDTNRLETLSTSPAAVSTPQPTPSKVLIDLPLVEVIPNNAQVPSLAELSINASISDPVILANLDAINELTSGCGTLIPLEEKQEIIEQNEIKILTEPTGSNGEVEKTSTEELNHFTRYVHVLHTVDSVCTDHSAACISTE